MSAMKNHDFRANEKKSIKSRCNPWDGWDNTFSGAMGKVDTLKKYPGIKDQATTTAVKVKTEFIWM